MAELLGSQHCTSTNDCTFNFGHNGFHGVDGSVRAQGDFEDGQSTCHQGAGQGYGVFHIVDDQLYDRALANIAKLLKPRGTFVWSDNFVHQPTVRVTHQVSRSLADISSALDRAGLEVVRRVPMFVLMNYPADTTSRLARWAWTAMVAPAMASDILGGALGALLYPLERRLVASRTESASTELMVCRKRA